jgi:hypothetical protein
MATDPPYPRQPIPDAAKIARIDGGIPWRLDEDGDLTVWKDGVWHLTGECIDRDDIGPHGMHCK